MNPLEVFLDLICPSMGVIMATLMFGAPIADLRKALMAGRLGDLNPFPWAMMTGNCLGWVVYGYYQHKDPFIVAANVPGLILSLWLNSGAAKLQYQEMLDLKRIEEQQESNQEEYDASPADENGDGHNHNINNPQRHMFHQEMLVTVPQERAMLRVLCLWTIVVVWAGWFDPKNAATTVGIVVNLNLCAFYGAPLKTIRTVVQERQSSSIHRPTMYMNWTNTTFWILYGLAKLDPIIILPNAIGLSLGLIQGLLCFWYPRTSDGVGSGDHEPLSLGDEDEAANSS